MIKYEYKEKTINGFNVYQLDIEECIELLSEAQEAMKFTYPENKGFTVALLT